MEESILRKRLVAAILAIAVLMMIDNVLALLQTTKTIPSSGTIEPLQGKQGQIQESEVGYYTAYYNPPAGQESIIRTNPSTHTVEDFSSQAFSSNTIEI